MKAQVYFLLILISLSGISQTIDEIRSEFHQVVLNPDDSKKFHHFISDVENPSPTVKAYQAVSEALLAQVVWNPFSKLSQVVKYDKMMGQVIEEDPLNIEIRFLRLAIEYNLPSFLGMSEHVKEDSQMIVRNMSSINQIQLDKSYGQYIFHFLSEANLCTEEEIRGMQRTLAMNQ